MDKCVSGPAHERSFEKVVDALEKTSIQEVARMESFEAGASNGGDVDPSFGTLLRKLCHVLLKALIPLLLVVLKEERNSILQI